MILPEYQQAVDDATAQLNPSFLPPGMWWVLVHHKGCAVSYDAAGNQILTPSCQIDFLPVGMTMRDVQNYALALEKGARALVRGLLWFAGTRTLPSQPPLRFRPGQ